MKELFKGKKILITGGAGSIGRELAREILKHEPEVIRLLDIDETRQFELQQELKGFKNVRFFFWRHQGQGKAFLRVGGYRHSLSRCCPKAR